MRAEPRRYYVPLLAALLLACIALLWLPLLRESFWLDETVTAFVIRHGASHPSLAAGPRLDQTIYYWLPRVSQALFGFSEISLRLPSLLATFVSLWLIYRIAARLIHPDAGWLAVFLCFIPHEFTRQATDARPYGFGTAVALTAMWFLVRWLDKGQWRDGAAFVVFAALLLRVHLIYWPFCLVFVVYAVVRRIRTETPVSGRALLLVFGVVAAALAPLVPVTLALFRTEKAHVVTTLPTWTDISGGFQIPMIVAAGLGSSLASRALRLRSAGSRVSLADKVLLIVWWLWQPACLLMVSMITRNSVFIPRYFSLALPGMMLTCAMAAGYSIPDRAWKPLAVLLAIGILAAGLVKRPFPPSRNSHWREAALAVNRLTRDSAMPVICPSPFVEAEPPVWTPAYAVPGFLYAHLDAYPVGGIRALLPARVGPEGERYAGTLIVAGKDNILSSGQFLIYGGTYSVAAWTKWFARQSRLADWRFHSVGSFGDVLIVLFDGDRR